MERKTDDDLNELTIKQLIVQLVWSLFRIVLYLAHMAINIVAIFNTILWAIGRPLILTPQVTALFLFVVVVGLTAMFRGAHAHGKPKEAKQILFVTLHVLLILIIVALFMRAPA